LSFVFWWPALEATIQKLEPVMGKGVRALVANKLRGGQVKGARLLQEEMVAKSLSFRVATVVLQPPLVAPQV